MPGQSTSEPGHRSRSVGLMTTLTPRIGVKRTADDEFLFPRFIDVVRTMQLFQVGSPFLFLSLVSPLKPSLPAVVAQAQEALRHQASSRRRSVCSSKTCSLERSCTSNRRVYLLFYSSSFTCSRSIARQVALKVIPKTHVSFGHEEYARRLEQLCTWGHPHIGVFYHSTFSCIFFR
jgi:hypothetical protein